MIQNQLFFDRVKSKDLRRVFGSQHAYRAPQVHLKRDGYCIGVMKDANGGLCIATRTPTILYYDGQLGPRVDHYSEINRFVEQLHRMPNDSIVFAEGFVEGETAHSMRSVLARVPTKRMSLEVFTVDRWAGNENFEELNFSFAERVVNDVLRLPYVAFHHSDVVTAEEIQQPPTMYEGFVLKERQRCGFGKHWWKIKPEDTVDLRIVDYTLGNNKYAGLIGALRLQSDDGTVACDCAAMTDDMRRLITSQRAAFVGRVVEVAYTEISKAGDVWSLRHPRFIRFREDKHETSTFRD